MGKRIVWSIVYVAVAVAAFLLASGLLTRLEADWAHDIRLGAQAASWMIGVLFGAALYCVALVAVAVYLKAAWMVLFPASKQEENK